MIKSMITVFSVGLTLMSQADVFTTSTDAPTGNILESFNAQDFSGTITISGMGPNRMELSGTKNRMAGQSLTIDQGTNVLADSITFRAFNSINFADGGTNTFEMYIVADNETLGSYTYNLSNLNLSKDEYITFDLGGVELESGVEYEFQMYYGEFDDDNKLLFERDQGGNSYAGGALFSYADTNGVINMPRNNQWTGGTSDMTFFLQGNVIPEPATLGMISAVGIGALFLRRLML